MIQSFGIQGSISIIYLEVQTHLHLQKEVFPSIAGGKLNVEMGIYCMKKYFKRKCLKMLIIHLFPLGIIL